MERCTSERAYNQNEKSASKQDVKVLITKGFLLSVETLLAAICGITKNAGNLVLTTGLKT